MSQIEEGRATVVAWTGQPLSPAASTHLRRQGVTLRDLSCPDPTGEESIPGVLGEGVAERSERLRRALQRLHGEVGFTEICFPSRGGLGFRAIQAQRAGVAFADVVLRVAFDGAHRLDREQAGRHPDGVRDLETDYCEQYAFEQANERIVAAADEPEVGRLGWSMAGPAPLHCPGGERPLVSVCVPHYNLGPHLPATLQALAVQTYPALEVLVIDDGSTDAASLDCFRAMTARFPHFRFLRQGNAGIGATRNRGLREARGRYFLPVDADNLPRPEMVERLVAAMEARPELTALSCYFLAFADEEGLRRRRYLHAYRPLGGAALLGCLRNVFGDASALYRTAVFRAAGGFEIDRGTSYEDWEAFARLVQAGHRIDVLPEVLFYYRHLPDGFSRRTRAHANHGRVLRQYTRVGPAGAGAGVWDLVAGMDRRLAELEARQRSLRYRIVDGIYALAPRVPGGIKRLVLAGVAALGRARQRVRPKGIESCSATCSASGPVATSGCRW